MSLKMTQDQLRQLGVMPDDDSVSIDPKVVQAAMESVKEGLISPDEAREFLGLPPMPYGRGADILSPLERMLSKQELRDFGPKLRIGHFLLFMIALAGWTLEIQTMFNFGSAFLAMILLYDVHQTRVLHELIYKHMEGEVDA